MKLIIDIPDEYFEQIKNNTEGSTAESEAVNAIRNGISYEERLHSDLISRDALKHKFAQIAYTRFTADMGQGGFEMFSEKEIEDIIDKAPTVEVDEMTQDLINKVNVNIGLAKPIKDERPQGKWICKDKVDGHMFGYSCSNCRNPEWQITRFCPNCGAKMKGGAENDKDSN